MILYNTNLQDLEATSGSCSNIITSTLEYGLKRGSGRFNVPVARL